MTSSASDDWQPHEAVAGLMAASALFLGAFEIAYRPFRLAPVAVILLLFAAVMTTRQQRLVGIGFAVVGICFVIGASVQVLTKHPLF